MRAPTKSRPVVAVIAVAATTVALVLTAWATSALTGPHLATATAPGGPVTVGTPGPGRDSPGPSSPGPPASGPPSSGPPRTGSSAGSLPESGAATSPVGGVPAPFVQDFGASTATPLPPAPSPTAPVVVPVSVDGCDHSYGAPTQCVPWQFPPGVTDRCAWLRAHGFGPLAVHGEDRLGLDPDRDGTACGPGDA